MTARIQALAEVLIVQNWKEGKRLYLRQIMRELDPDGSANLDSGTLRKELEVLVFQGNLGRSQRRIVDNNQKARKVVCYEPTLRLLHSHESLHMAERISLG